MDGIVCLLHLFLLFFYEFGFFFRCASAEGATGPTGPTGESGADGIVGQISGVVPTTADLPTTDIDPGTLYYVEEDDGVYLWDDTTGQWILVNMAQGPRGATGPTGPTGPQGADGIMGPIQGIVASVADLPSTGVSQGDLFYVEDDGLYAWDATNGWTPLGLAEGPRGLPGTTGPTGPAGPAASSYMIIPFASAEAPMTHAINSEPSVVSLLGFGYGDRRHEDSLEAADYFINIDPSDRSFNLTQAAGNDNKQLVFSLPFDVSIRSLYITVGNYGEFDPNNAVFPYVQLYRAEAGSNHFELIEGAVAKPTEGIGPGTDVPADTMRSAHVDGLDIRLPAGTRIGICAMMEIPGYTGGASNYWLYYTGGIGLSYEPAP